MDRRAFISGIAFCLLATPLAAGAQLAGKAHRIGFLSGGPAPTSSTPDGGLEAFRQELRDLGYVEGRNILIEYRWAEGRFERLPDLATELVGLSVEAIVAATTQPALAAKQATRTIPIVMVVVGDPIGTGLVATLARPGGNVTGLSYYPGPEIAGKQLELLKDAFPRVSRVAVLWNPANPWGPIAFRETEKAARSLRVKLHSLEVRSPGEIETAFRTLAKDHADALLVHGDAMVLPHRERIVSLIDERRLPAMFNLREFVDAGGLMAYSVSIPDSYRRAAIYVDKVLKGAKPADLPVQQPTTFELVINLKTAKALGLTIPPSLLLRADQVIE